MENLYEILDIECSAETSDVRKSYYRLAKLYHPDTGNGDEAAFQKINHAYNILSNPDSRRDYDRTLENFNKKTSDFDSYAADYYQVTGDKVQKLLKELVRQTNLTRVKIKYKNKTIIDVPITAATAVTTAGLLMAPIPTILINLGISRFFQMEVTNEVMDKYEETVKLHESGRLSEAEYNYRNIIEKSEYFVPAYMNLGMLYRQLGENKKAEESFRKVLDIAPFGEIGTIARNNLTEIRGF